MNRKVITQLWLCLLCLLPGRAVAQTLEYWFDDHYDLRSTTSIATSDAEQELSLDLRDNTKFPFGLHRLNMRVFIGGKPSAVYTSHVLKLSAGKASRIEYWLDDDMGNSKTIDGEISNDGNAFQFIGELDLSDATPGHHRLYYRAVSNSKRTATAVSCTPSMVKSRYYVENPENLKVTKYSITVDNEEPLILDIPSPQGTITIPYTLDARRFSTGVHNLTSKFWNSLGLNVTDQSTFTVVEQETPSIILTATTEDCNVKLAFNSIPNDVHYIVVRMDESGKTRKVYETYNSNYPNRISVVDNPVAGSYTYFVRAAYTDIDENQHVISSNEQSLSLEGHDAAPQGRIVGRVFFGEQGIDLISAVRMIYAEFSDGDEKARIEPNGSFYRDGIPLGTKLTISIPDDDYFTYEKLELEVTENTRNEVQIIKATRQTDNSVQLSNTNHDLVITSLRVSESQDNFELQVQNITGQIWRGSVKLIAVRTKDLEKSSSSQMSNFPLSAFKTYYDAGSTNINYIPNGDIQPINIKITGIPSIDDGETYSFFIVSSERGKDNSLKLLDCSKSTSITNPFTMWIEGDDDFNYYAYRNKQMLNDGVAEILSMMKTMDKGVGPFTFALKDLEDDLRQYEIDHEFDGLFGNLPDILKDVSVDLRNAVADVKEFTDLIGSAKNFFDYVNTFEIFNGNDYTAKFTKLSQIVTDWAFDGNPFAKIYSQYFEAVDHAYDVANGWSKHFNDLLLGRKFDDHEVIIEVDVDGYWGNLLNSFHAKDVQEKIVKAELHMRQNDNWSHRLYTPKLSGSDVFLEYAYDLPSSSPHQEFRTDIPIDEFYMDVYWEGDLMTTVWLLDDTKVEYTLGRYRVKFKSSASHARNLIEGLHWQPLKN